MDKEIHKGFQAIKKLVSKKERELVSKDKKRDRSCDAIRHKLARER